MHPLALLFSPSLADVYTYPVKSVNLDRAAPVTYYNGFQSSSFPTWTSVAEAHMVYAVSTSDGGVVMCGKGAETGTIYHEAIVAKVTSSGTASWAWQSNALGEHEVCSGLAQLPNGGDILVAGYRTVSGIATGFLTKLSLATGAESWTSHALLPAASTGAYSALESVSVDPTLGVLVLGISNIPNTDESERSAA
eukprot:2910115-Prymnesium_polylepis.1